MCQLTALVRFRAYFRPLLLKNSSSLTGSTTPKISSGRVRSCALSCAFTAGVNVQSGLRSVAAGDSLLLSALAAGGLEGIVRPAGGLTGSGERVFGNGVLYTTWFGSKADTLAAAGFGAGPAAVYRW